MIHDVIAMRDEGRSRSEYSTKRIADLCDKIRTIRAELYPGLWDNNSFPVDSVLISSLLDQHLENYQNVKGGR